MGATADRHVAFVAGSTGYIGRALVSELLKRGHAVRALARAGSEGRVPQGATIVHGDALDAATYRDVIAPADTFVHLIGVPHASPSKAPLFRSVDLKSVQEAVPAAKAAGVRHFVYLSVAQPAPIMKAYVDVRQECESLVRASGMAATFVRPWYVLGEGHWWPLVLVPAYFVAERLPWTREGARRLGLNTLAQVVATLAGAVERPPDGVRVVEVPEIRASPSGTS